MRIKLKAPKKKRFVNSKRSFNEYCSLYNNTENPQKYFRWQKTIDKEKLVESLASSLNISLKKKPTPNPFENSDPSDHKVLFVKLPNRAKAIVQSPATTVLLEEKDTHSSLGSMAHSEQSDCAANLIVTGCDYHSEEVNMVDRTLDKPQEDFDTTLNNFISRKEEVELDIVEKNCTTAMTTEIEMNQCPLERDNMIQEELQPIIAFDKEKSCCENAEEYDKSTTANRESYMTEEPLIISFRSFRDPINGERGEFNVLGDEGKYTPKSVKEILSERAANIERNRILNQDESHVTPEKISSDNGGVLTQKPFANSFNRLHGLSESIQKSVNELNEQLSLTKNSVSKLKNASNNNNSQNTSQEQQRPQEMSECNEHPENLELERFSLMTPEASRHDHQRENQSTVSFPKPSCQKSLYKYSVHKETPCSREVVIDGVPNPDRICSCKPKSSVAKCTQECEGTPSKRLIEKVTWVSNSDVPVKLNKAERLRMDYIRKKAQTAAKSPSKQGKNAAGESEKSWSVGKTNLLF